MNYVKHSYHKFFKNQEINFAHDLRRLYLIVNALRSIFCNTLLVKEHKGHTRNTVILVFEILFFIYSYVIF